MSVFMAEETKALALEGTPELFYRCWQPQGQARGAVLLVHGVSEHSGRYGHVGEFLASRGLSVHAYDQRGHGRSGGREGWVEKFDDFLDDLAAVHAYVRERSVGLPLFLLGHSMGGLVVTAYLLERPAKPDFVVLSGPAIVPILAPGDRTIDPSRLSRDPEVQRAYMDDPLVLRERVSDELFMRLADGLGYIVGRGDEIRLPLLLIQGSDDLLCSAEGNAAYLGGTSADRTIKIYPEGRHEMFNETNREQVLADLWQWMQARLAAN
jgi:acylglycerol lipase